MERVAERAGAVVGWIGVRVASDDVTRVRNAQGIVEGVLRGASVTDDREWRSVVRDGRHEVRRLLELREEVGPRPSGPLISLARTIAEAIPDTVDCGVAVSSEIAGAGDGRYLETALLPGANERRVLVGRLAAERAPDDVWNELTLARGLTERAYWYPRRASEPGPEASERADPRARRLVDWPRNAPDPLERGLLDETGFLRSEDGTTTLEEVRARPGAYVVVGEPWSGKSTEAKRIFAWLRARKRSAVELSFEEAIPTEKPWSLVTDESLVLIADAVDEGYARRVRVVDELRSFLRRLQQGATLLAFCRESFVGRFLEDLEDLEDLAPRVFRLAPMTEAAAVRDVLGTDEALLRVEERVEELGDRTLVRDIKLLHVLGQADTGPGIDAFDDALLRSLCEVHSSGHQITSTQVERVEVASELAAALQFSGRDEVDLEASGSVFDDDRRRAALDLTATTLLVRGTGTTWRFRQQFARERFAARALSRAREPLARSLLMTAIDRPDPRQRAVLDALVRYHGGASSGQLYAALRDAPGRPLRHETAVALFDALVRDDGQPDELRRSASDEFFWIEGSGALVAIAHPEVAERARALVTSPAASLYARRLCVYAAKVNRARVGWGAVMDALLEPALDPDTDYSLRYLCVDTLLAWGGAERAGKLDALVATDSGDESLRALVLARWLTDKREAPLAVAGRAPEPEHGHLDARSELIRLVAAALDGQEIRHVIDLELERRADPVLPSATLARLFEASLNRWREGEWSGDDDADRLRRLLDRYDYGYARLTERIRAASGPQRRWLWDALGSTRNLAVVRLKASDAAWLSERAEEGPLTELQVRRAYAFAALGSPRSPELERLGATLRSRYGDLVERFDAEIEKQSLDEAEARTQYAADEAERRDERVSLASVLERVRAELDDPVARLRAFGDFLRGGHDDVVGTLDLLSRTEREKLALAVRRDLAVATPSLRAAGGRDDWREGFAFATAVVELRDVASPAPWLTPAVVARWLPVALSSDALGAPGELLAICFPAAPDATRDAALGVLEHDAGRTGRPRLGLVHVPFELWSDEEFARGVVELALRTTTRDEVARDLLWSLAYARGPSIRALLPLAPPVRASLVAAVRLALANGDGIRSEGALDARALGPLAPHRSLGRGPWRPDLRAWRVDSLECLVSQLLAQRPPHEDIAPEERDPESNVGALLFVASQELMRRAEGAAALARLGHDEQVYANMARRLRARAEAERLYNEYVRLPDRSPREVLRMLESGRVDPLRSADDLFYVVLDTVREIGASIASDCDQLRPMGQETTWRELRLQSYLGRRLTDLLKPWKLGVHLAREPEGAKGKIPDWVLISGEHTIVIEVKWSHDTRRTDATTREGLDKLVHDYMRADHRAHGIFFVGFTGRAPNPDREALVPTLETEARALCPNDGHERLAVVVSDLIDDP